MQSCKKKQYKKNEIAQWIDNKTQIADNQHNKDTSLIISNIAQKQVVNSS